jgi:beta-mannosidase
VSVLSLDSTLDQTGGTWTVRATAGPVPDAHTRVTHPVEATVPGEVQLDLMAAGLIPDPFDGDNESRLAWIGYCDWQYATRFTWHSDGESRHDLVADGLDTAAIIRLNGQEIARTANQHRHYRFEIGKHLLNGENELVIDFRSPIEFAREQEQLLGARPNVMHHPFNAIRKAASNFGWDWGIDVSSSGIWKSIRIESWSGVRIDAVRPLVSVDSGRGTLTAHVDLEWADPAHASARTLRASVNDRSAEVEVAPGTEHTTLIVDAGEVELWWPRTHGEQPLYEVDVAVSETGDGVVERAGSAWHGRVGFRTITVDTTPDEHGTPFTFVVNGEPVYVRGANWIPHDAFLTRISRQRYRDAVCDAVESNMNMLRVWGGGIYESDDFYDACDEFGILVWQDFLFACAAYAEEDPLRSEVEAEARQAITRLSTHPSLALWNGCNENIWGYVEWGWRPHLGDKSWGKGYYLELLPALMAELDPTRAYSPGSPFSFVDFAHPNDSRNGTMHIWDVWNVRDYNAYAQYVPRFVSEFGFQGPPAWSTLSRVVHDEPLDPYGPEMLVHQKAAQGNIKLERGLGDHVPQPTDIAHWHWATQLNQARAVAFGIEHFRSLFPLNSGSIVWQLNDDWPVVSWAAVDHDGHRKPLWHALRRVYADRLLTFQSTTPVHGDVHGGNIGVAEPSDANAEHGSAPGTVLVAHNDSAERWTGRLTIDRCSVVGGQALAEQQVNLDVAARSAVRIELVAEVLEANEPAREFVRARVDDGVATSAWHYFVEDTQLSLVPQREALRTSVERIPDGYGVTVTARSLAKDVTLQVDRLDASAKVDTALVTLASGESHQFVVTSSAELDPDGFSAFPVLSSANELIEG